MAEELEAKPILLPPGNDGSTGPAGPMCVVGVGASAGGLEALEMFFDAALPNEPVAYVVIQHLSPDYKSLMVELLSRHTTMPVLRAENGMRVEAGHVYLIPPKTDMTIHGGTLVLSEQPKQGGVHLPIDLFFRSLADDMGDRAIAIVLSGTGSDGTRGVRGIKEAGGLVMVQDENQAKFDGMPRAASSTGLVDMVLRVEQMPAEIQSYVRSLTADGEPRPIRIPTDADMLSRVMEAVKRQTGADFTLYKPSTVLRRIDRRMTVLQCKDLAAYVRALEEYPRERVTLAKELLIGVTKFFRDPEAFELLTTKIVPRILDETRDGDPVRVWVSAVSTGEEAYSIAMVFLDQMAARNTRRELKIFATDIDRDAVESAAQGVYPESIVADVGAERLARYFTSKGESYQVNRALREVVVFAQHNLAKDPPLTRMNLVSCRNLLIYFQPALQKKVLSLLTYALVPGGFLFMGSSETIGASAQLFTPIDTRWKLYRLTAASRRPLSDILQLSGQRAPAVGATRRMRETSESEQLLERVHQELTQALGLKCVVVDAEMRIVHTYGDLSNLVEMQPGRASLDLTRMVPPELATPLRGAIAHAMRDGREVFYQRAMRDESGRFLSIRVRPVSIGSEIGLCFLVFFETERATMPLVEPVPQADAAVIGQDRVQSLETELQYTRENLQATIEELETANEELQATNEELLASNEELQSTNEELQSLNEELQTVNSEYQQKNDELTQLNNDIENILRITEVGIIMLDPELRIRKFTPATTVILNAMPQDVGRPIEHISTRPANLDLAGLARRVLNGEEEVEMRLRTDEGRHLVTRVRPYLHNRGIMGVVLHITEVTHLVAGEERLQGVIDALPAEICVLDEAGIIRMVNRAWTDFASRNGDPECAVCGVGADYFAACSKGAAAGDLDAAVARQGLSDLLTGRIRDFEHEYPCHSPTEERWFLMRAVPLPWPRRGIVIWHLDITRRRLAEVAARVTVTDGSGGGTGAVTPQS